MNGIDVHSHFLPKEAVDRLDVSVIKEDNNIFKIKIGERTVGPLTKGFFDVGARIEEMEKLGVDFQVLSVTHHLFMYKADKNVAEKAAKIQNDALAKIQKKHSDRFVCNATLPLSYPDLALRELDRVYYDLELRGVEIGTNIAGKNLDSEELFPIYEKLQDYDLPILVHPNDILGAERLKKYYMPIMIGTLMETTIAITSVIFGGVLKKFPKLKFIFCHGGGAIPYQIGRLQRALDVRDECKGVITGKVVDYLKKVYMDTVLFDDKALKFMIERIGEDRALLGTDYPFNMGEWGSLSRIKRLDLTREAIEKITLINAKKLFKISY